MFPVIHNLLDAKINSVLSLSHDKSILGSVQSLIYQMIACSAGDDASQQQQQLSYLQSCAFGGLWRFAGPFTVSRLDPDNVQLFVNCLEAMVETCLSSFEDHADGSEHSGIGSSSMGQQWRWSTRLVPSSSHLSTSPSSLFRFIGSGVSQHQSILSDVQCFHR